MKLKLKVKLAPFPALNDLLDAPLAFSPPALGAAAADISSTNYSRVPYSASQTQTKSLGKVKLICGLVGAD